MYLGLKGDARATIKEISDCYGISKNHLMKIVQDLSREGVLNTVRGKSGGIRLARPAEAICIGDVVRMTEPDFRIVECFGDGEQNCRISGTCVLTTPINEAMEAFLEVLDGNPLSDIHSRTRSIPHLPPH